MLGKDILVIDRHSMTEDLRVRDLHHGGFHVKREQYALFGRVLNLLFEECAQRLDAHEGGIHHFARLQGHFRLQDGRLAILADKLDPHFSRRGRGQRLFIRKEISTLHVTDV